MDLYSPYFVKAQQAIKESGNLKVQYNNKSGKMQSLLNDLQILQMIAQL
jgi:hypothetical protein